MMQSLSLSVLLCVAWPAEAVNSTFVSYDGKQHDIPESMERKRLRHFLGLRTHPHRYPVVYQHLPEVHHGLHMLNHQVNHRVAVGPLLKGPVQPFVKKHHRRTMLNATAPIAAHAIAKPGWDQIKETRANTCVTMLKKHGPSWPKNRDKCIAFMVKECPAVGEPSRPAICDVWFDLLQKEQAVGAPSPAIAASPQAAEEAFDAPSGLKHPGVMDENEKMPEQGFSGELVAHDNMKTATADWHAEYGPHATPSYEAICAEYPDNLWCKLRGYHNKTPAPTEAPPSSPWLSSTLFATMMASLCLCLAALACLR